MHPTPLKYIPLIRVLAIFANISCKGEETLLESLCYSLLNIVENCLCC